MQPCPARPAALVHPAHSARTAGPLRTLSEVRAAQPSTQAGGRSPATPAGKPLAIAIAAAIHVALGGVLAFAPPLHAQADNEERMGVNEGEQRLGTVTVRARRSLEERFMSTGSRVTVDRQDIEQMGADSVVDVLRQVPGLQVSDSGGNLEIRVRGMERGATQILVDGQRSGNSRRGAQLPFDQLPADMIERIEVLRAPSAEYSGASGGTVNIVLRQNLVRQDNGIRLTDRYVWGRHAPQVFLSSSGPLNKLPDDPAALAGFQPWTYTLMASAGRRVHGSDIERSSISDPDAAQGSSFNTSRGSRDQWMLIPRVSGKLGPRDQITLRAFALGARSSSSFTSTGTSDSGQGPTAGDSSQSGNGDRLMLQLRSDWAHRFEDSRLESSLSTERNSESTTRQRIAPLDPLASPAGSTLGLSDERTENVLLATTKLTGTRGELLWMAGAEYEDRRLQVDTVTNRIANGLLAPPQSQDLSSGIRRTVLWGQNEWALPARTTLTAGLRAEHLQLRSTYGGNSYAASTVTWQPTLHTRTPITENLQLRLNAARLTRKPALLDLIDRALPGDGANAPDNPDTAGNPTLRPEITLSLDAGLDLRLAGSGNFGINVFTRQVSDVIARRVGEETGRWVQRPQNVGDAIVWGIETDMRTSAAWLGLPPEWNLSGNASLLQSRMTSGDVTGNRIPGQARYLLSANLARPMPARSGGWFGGASLSLTGPADLATAPGTAGSERAWADIDLHIGRAYRGLGFWRFAINNLTDVRRIRDRSNTDATGRILTDSSSERSARRFMLTVGTRF